jgi:hypothetical protein
VSRQQLAISLCGTAEEVAEKSKQGPVPPAKAGSEEK